MDNHIKVLINSIIDYTLVPPPIVTIPPHCGQP